MNYLFKCAVILIFSGISLTGGAQKLIKIPNPVDYGGREYGGCQGSYPIIYNGDLYMQYVKDDYNHNLFKYDGVSLTEITSPIGYSGFSSGYKGSPVIYKNNLYLSYMGDDGNQDLFKYDGVSLTEISSPLGYDTSGIGYLSRYIGNGSDPIIYNNNLYLIYNANDYNNDLMKYNGVTFTPIPSPSGFSAGSQYGGCSGGFIVYNGNLYMRYRNDNGSFELFKYNGVTLTEINSPSGAYSGVGSGYAGSPVVYNNNLYTIYKSDAGNFDLYRNTGGTSLFKITLPAGYNLLDPDRGTNMNVYNGNLYIGLKGSDGNTDLFKYNGTTFTQIPSPVGYAGNNTGYTGGAFNVLGKMYLLYFRDDGNAVLFSYDGSTLKEIPNNTSGYNVPNSGLVRGIIAFDGDVYLGYRHIDGNDVLFKYDGSSLTEIPSPLGYLSPPTPPSYQPSGIWNLMIEYNNELYLSYMNDFKSFDLFKLDPNLPIGVEEITESSFRLYPNPTQNDFTIELDGNHSITDISITSVQGQTVYAATNLKANKLVVNTEQWSNGVYVVSLRGDVIVKTMKLVKQ